MVIALTHYLLLWLLSADRKREEIKERGVKTGSKRKERADEVSGEDHANVTGDHLPGTLEQHGKLLEISEEFLIPGNVLKVMSDF